MPIARGIPGILRRELEEFNRHIAGPMKSSASSQAASLLPLPDPCFFRFLFAVSCAILKTP